MRMIFRHIDIGFFQKNDPLLFCRKLLAYAFTLSIAGLGVCLAQWIKIPLPFMLGPMIALALVSIVHNAFSDKNYRRNEDAPKKASYAFYFLAFIKASLHIQKIPNVVLRLTILMVGVYIGARFDPVMFERLAILVPLIVLLLLSLIIGIPLGYFFLRKTGLGKAEALASALPGAFTLILLHVSTFSIPLKHIAMIHCIRIILLLFLIPLFFQNILETSKAPFLADETGAPYWDWVRLFAITLSLALAADKWIPLQGSGFIFASFFATTLYGLGWITAPPPEALFNAILFTIAIVISSRLTDFDWKTSWLDVCRGMGLTLLFLFITSSFSLLFLVLSPYMTKVTISFAAGWLALIPGGIHEVSLIAIIYNLDPMVIAFVHWLRVILIAVAFPILLRVLVHPSQRSPPQ